nr:protein cordon-bleu isoform X3 [Misgurnus anguillicaudatus]XP_055065455.1 protein cordon-bleu isoform X3 [Misgurnus anguillicaudatus]XP_055065456.1 protein cordon-bleu isoform X3 [Misgurnus anguillicaudatus]XP_055065457.1 protein cordon-bleu isoform X3 [Misgurnus anguillicaudatus]XP_055065458.1 protein cordon-bleu isoform X3 [Misgurnus anguillicaudatus]
MKARAPPPPRPPQPAPRKVYRNAVPDGGGSSVGDSKENILQSSVDLHITLPTGYQTTIIVDGRKALMDLLVDLCSQYHLNPSYHTLELLSPDAQPVSFKPNALLGALDVSCALIKERVFEDKVIRKPPPKVPEKTVRVVVNYHRNQKAVVRVNPLVPLRTLVPVICQKCDFDPACVLLLRDNISNHQLDLDKSLSDLEIKELYVLDQTLVLRPKMALTPGLSYSADSLHSSQSLSGSDKKGLLGFLRFNRRKSKTGDQSSEDMDSLDGESVVDNADTNMNGVSSVASGPCIETRPSTLGQSQSAMNISRMSPKVELKKRQAPAPPPAPTQMTTSQLKKRKAPAPPPTPTPSTPEPVCSTLLYEAPMRAPRIPVPAERTLVAVTTTSADDSVSDLSHSIEDSEPAGSICSSSSGDDAAAGSSCSSLAEEPVAHRVQVIAEYTPSKPQAEPVPKHKEEPSPKITREEEPGPSPTLEETAVRELKMEEMENNRNSGIAWLHSAHKSESERVKDQEVETMSVGSCESFADQGYAASEGMAEEPNPVSLSETIQSASPVSIVSLNGGSDVPVKQSKDSSSDSDEGCATWGSRHSTGNIQRGHQPIKRQNSYEEDPEITAQIHLTLAALDANLADMNQSDGGSMFVDDEIPVSVVDMDIPVTTIDEVPTDDTYSKKEHLVPASARTSNITKQSRTLYEAIQNKNNNASLTAKNVSPSSGIQKQLQDPKLTKNMSPSPDNQKQLQEPKITDIKKIVSPPPDNQKQLQEPKPSDNKEQKFALNHDTKGKAKTEGPNGQNNTVSQKPQSQVVRQTVQSIQKVSDDKLKSLPVVRKLSTETVNEERMPVNTMHGKITQSSVSRFGMKTFVVVPPKPTVSQTQKPAGSLVVGAIKIDEQGNMVTRRQINTTSEKHGRHEEVTNVKTESTPGQAKAFWNLAEKQEQDQSTMANQGPTVKNRDTNGFKPSSVSAPFKLSEKSHIEETPKEVIILERKSIPVVANKPSFLDPVENPGEGRDLSFLKPSRRTSSQYVASAIAKNSSIPNAKIHTIQEPPESVGKVQKLPFNQPFKNEGKPPNTPSVGLYKPATTLKPTERSTTTFAGPTRSQSNPSYVAEKVVISENFSSVKEETFLGVDKTKSLDLHSTNKVQSLTQKSAHIKPIKSFSEEATSISKFPDTSFPRQMPTDSTRPPLGNKSEVHKSEPSSEPNQGNMFGSVKKFKPVIFKPVQKDASLHSSLMEAIQSGEGIERLKKVSPSSNSTIKKPSFGDAENEHSALLSAIRASTNTSRLKKTKSEAAKELEQFRTTEEDRNIQKDNISPPPTSPPAFVPPPPPAFCPPPPPSKPPLVLPAGGNPEATREALLEAIRSGSGAQRLRKVPATQTRRKVNGKLGTVQATSALSHGH